MAGRSSTERTEEEEEAAGGGGRAHEEGRVKYGHVLGRRELLDVHTIYYTVGK